MKPKRQNYRKLYHALFIKHLALKMQIQGIMERCWEKEKHFKLVQDQIKSWKQ